MTERSLTQASKWMSLVLRHDPAKFGVELDQAGWTRIGGPANPRPKRYG